MSKKVYKLADMNHVQTNLSKKIYKIKPKFKQLNKKGLISHIKKCFAYALSQCKQNAVNLASAVQSITDHLINRHQNCGAWCRTKNKK